MRIGWVLLWKAMARLFAGNRLGLLLLPQGSCYGQPTLMKVFVIGLIDGALSGRRVRNKFAVHPETGWNRRCSSVHFSGMFGMRVRGAVAELADALDLGSSSFGSAGSIPVSPTRFRTF